MKKLLLVMALAFVALFAVGCGEKSHSVTFMVDGTAYETVDKVASGDTAAFPAQPSKPGYTFTGWYEEGATEPFSEDTAIKSDVVLYAAFTEHAYTLKFDANGAEGSMDSAELAYSQEYKLPACTFTYTDNLFAGWALTADGEVAYDDEETVSKLTEADGATVTLYAVWDSQSYTVAFDGNGGLGKMDALTVGMSREFDLTACTFIRQDWHFAGWALSADGEIVYTDGQKVKGLSDENGATVTLYAIWEQDTYTVRFDKNDDAATGTMADQTFTLKEEKALSENAFVKSGYNFMGWALTADGEVVYEDEELVSGLADAHGQTVTLYAVFKGEPETYTIVTKTENAQGSFDEEQVTKNGYFDDVVTVTADPKTGYSVEIEGNGVKLDGGNDTVITVTYSLVDYTAKLVGVYGDKEFDIDSQAFTYLSETFSLEAADRKEVDGVAYRYIEKGVSLEVAKNTADNVTIKVEYGVEVTDAEGLVDAMQNHPAQSVVLANDIDMKNYLAAHPWDSAVTDNGAGAFFNQDFSGTLDGKGYSILNLNSTAGLVERYTNVVFKKITETGTVKNLHLQVSIGLSLWGEGARMGLLFGDMYGTVDNCFFEMYVQFNNKGDAYGAAPIYNLGDNSKVTNTVFYIPNSGALRMIVSTTWGGDFEGKGTFENLAFVYGEPSVGNALPAKYNERISDIYIVAADLATGTFKDAKKLNPEAYAAGASENTNNESYWDSVSLADINSALTGFTFTENTLAFGGCTIVNNVKETIEVSDAEGLVYAMTYKPWANISLKNDIDMSGYLAEHPWNSTSTGGDGAFFRQPFSGTLDGKGYSILNLNSTSGLVGRYTNVVFREISAGGTVKNLHLQASIGIKAGYEAERLAYLAGDMYGTIDNCFFEVDAQYYVNWMMYGAGPFYNLAATTSVTNSVFYVANPAPIRTTCSLAWADCEGLGTFENLVYVYGQTDYKNALPTKYNPSFKNIYFVRADNETGTFTDLKMLNTEKYAAGASTDTNSADYWDDTSFEAINSVMTGFTFAEKSMQFGETVIVDHALDIEVSDAFAFVRAVNNNHAASIKLTNDIDMSEYLALYPWSSTDSESGAFFNFTFAGTIDGQGYSIYNFNSVAGVIPRWQNDVFKVLGETGVIKNLHIQVSVGVDVTYLDHAFFIGDMYGTIENCFFEFDVQTNPDKNYAGTAAFYRLASTSVVKDTVFYISNPAGFRLMCASTGDASRIGTFENVTYIYGSFDYNNLLPDAVNPNISNIYIIREDASSGTFTDAKALTADYAAGESTNGEELWTASSLEDITAAMTDADAGVSFTFTEKTLSFGEKVIKNFNVA